MLNRCWSLLFPSSDRARLEAFYDCFARFYVLVHPFVRAVAHYACQLLTDHPPLIALDVCSGTGILAEALTRQGHSVTRIDLSSGMLARRKARLQALRVPAIRMDARQLGFRNRSFDLSAISMALHEFNATDRVQILSEMARVSRQYVLVADFCGPQPWFIRIAEHLERSHFNDFTDGNLTSQLTATGLEIMKTARWHTIGLYLCRVPTSL